MSFLPYYLRRRRMRHVQKQIRKSEKHKRAQKQVRIRKS
jgi:hypothetical protein